MAQRNNQQQQRRSASAKSAPKKGAAPKKEPAPKQRKQSIPEDNSPGAVIWKFTLILCCALVLFSLLFTSINGGSVYVGLPEKKTETTPTPPVATIDPSLDVSGSDMTPIPPSASPEVSPDTGTGDGQNPTP